MFFFSFRLTVYIYMAIKSLNILFIVKLQSLSVIINHSIIFLDQFYVLNNALECIKFKHGMYGTFVSSNHGCVKL